MTSIQVDQLNKDFHEKSVNKRILYFFILIFLSENLVTNIKNDKDGYFIIMMLLKTIVTIYFIFLN